MKYCYTITMIALLLSCNKPEHTDSDFSGKNFTARIKLDSMSKDPLALGVLTAMSISFEFKGNGEGIYKVGTGAATNDLPFTWSVKSDSLFITKRIDAEEEKTNQYSIKDIPEGMLINDGLMPFELTERQQ